MTVSLSRSSLRVFTVFLIVALPLLAVAAVLALGVGQNRLRHSYGLHLSSVAEQASAAIDAYVFRRIVESSILTRVNEVRQAAAEASREPFAAEATYELDRQWQRRGSAPAAAAPLLENRASAFLADVVKYDPIYREVLLTDRHGRLVAASNLTSDYYQADEDWWNEAFGDGVRGQVSVTDVRFDRSARVHALEIALPVAEPGSDRLAGILKVVADIRELATVIDGIRLGGTGEAALLRSNGTLVLSRRPQATDARYFAADLMRERLEQDRLAHPSYSQYFSALGPDGERLVALAASQLPASYPHLTWLVAVSQTEEELFAPIRAQLMWLGVSLSVTVIAVLVLALWFAMRLASHPVHEDMHLVEHAPTPQLEEAV